MDAEGWVFLAVCILVALAIYFFPWLVALSRAHRNVLAIFVLNLLLGWSVIGWVVALVWAFVVDKSDA